MRQQYMAQQLLNEGANTAPVQSPWEGLARIGIAGIGGYLANQAGDKEKSYQQALAAALSQENPLEALKTAAQTNPDLAPAVSQFTMQNFAQKQNLANQMELDRAKRAGEPPKTRTIERDGIKVTQEWDPNARAWQEIAQSQPDWMNPAYVDVQKDIRRAGKAETTVNVGGDNQADAALRKKLSEKEGERWSALKEAGVVSASLGQDFQALDALMNVAPQGPIQGRLAEAFPGFSSAGDAFQSIVVRVAPTLRTPGSGATSDIEYEGMLKSLPRLRNKPEANRAIAEMMKAKAALNVERSQVVTAYENQQIDAATARSKLEELNKRSIMSPQLKGLLEGIGGGGNAPDGDGWRDLGDGIRIREKP